MLSPATRAWDEYPSKKETMVVLALLGIATFVLMPRFMEPGGESWKGWAAARIMRETGGFPVFSMGPLYVVYLQLFSFFEYPFAMRAEFIVTHFFAHASLYLMLRGQLPLTFALLLTCAWIPLLGYVEPGGAVAGIGFLGLFLSGRIAPLRAGYFPPALIAAALCHSAYWGFAIAHGIGKFIERCKGSGFGGGGARWLGGRLRSIAQLFLGLVLSLTVLMPSQRIDRNHMLIDPTYMPLPMESPLTMGFFQLGAVKYLERHPEAKTLGRLQEDMYFVHQEVYGDAQTILQAAKSKTEIVVDNLVENFLSLALIPKFCLFGRLDFPLMFFSIIAVAVLAVTVGAIGLSGRLLSQGAYGLFLAISLGTGAVLCALLLTQFSERYVMTLLPVWLIVVTSVGQGIELLGKAIAKTSRIGSHKISISMGVLIAVAVGGVWVADFAIPTKLEATVFGALSFALYKCLARVGDSVSISHGGHLVTLALIMSSSVGLGAATVHHYPEGKGSAVGRVHLNAVVGGEPILRGDKAFQALSLTRAQGELMPFLKDHIHILACEVRNWLLAFTSVPLDSLHHIYSLPPFPGQEDQVRGLLDKLDLVILDVHWSKTNPRHLLYVEPFLRDALRNGWNKRRIDMLGEVYYKVDLEDAPDKR